MSSMWETCFSWFTSLNLESFGLFLIQEPLGFTSCENGFWFNCATACCLVSKGETDLLYAEQFLFMSTGYSPADSCRVLFCVFWPSVHKECFRSWRTHLKILSMWRLSETPSKSFFSSLLVSLFSHSGLVDLWERLQLCCVYRGF